MIEYLIAAIAPWVTLLAFRARHRADVAGQIEDAEREAEQKERVNAAAWGLTMPQYQRMMSGMRQFTASMNTLSTALASFPAPAPPPPPTLPDPLVDKAKVFIHSARPDLSHIVPTTRLPRRNGYHTGIDLGGKK